jgi:hypothetical protein
MDRDTRDTVTETIHPSSSTDARTNRKRKSFHPEPYLTSVTTAASTSHISFLGNYPSERMCVISPPTTGNIHQSESKTSYILNGLKQIDRIFRQRRTKRYLARVVNDDDVHECRLIQGSRFEIFVQSQKYGSSVWNKILQRGGFENPQHYTEDLVNFAIERARKDPRVGQSNIDWSFDNFSLIVTYSKVSEQEPHVDLLLPNFQFGMVVSDGSPSTWYYEVPPEAKISNGKQLADLWVKLDPTIPDQLTKLLEKCPDVNNKLESYGSVLSVSVPPPNNPVLHSENLERPFIKYKTENVPCGTVLSLPGSQVHGGPSTDEVFRAVLFFSGHPRPTENDNDDYSQEDTKSMKQRENMSEAYDPDTQYSNVLLMTSILQMLWRRYQVMETTRIYLLKRLHMYMTIARSTGATDNIPKWHRHFFEHVELKAMIETMESRIIEEEKKKRLNPNFTKKSWNSFYKNYAKDDDLSSLHLETTEHVGEFRLVSVKGLHLEYDGIFHKASLFRRDVDNRVLIYYSDSNDWEGSKSSDHYQIKWSNLSKDASNKQIMFDGSNGSLLDSDGNTINTQTFGHKD